jgi:hypothetical protein
MSTRRTIMTVGRTLALSCVLLAAPWPAFAAQLSAPKAPTKSPAAKLPPAEPREIPKDMAAIFMSAGGLTPTSPREYWVYTPGGPRVKACTAGRAEAVPPGKYEVRVGFPSGWLPHQVELKAGDRCVVPTGLFAFQEVTPPDWPSTVPQELRAGDTYLVSGYQGTTVRLLPGKYTVCYQDPIEPKPSECFSTWYVAGPFVGGTSGRGLDAEYPPDKESSHNPQITYTVGRATVAWRKLDGTPEADLQEAVPASGVAYAFSTLEADVDKTVQLTVGSHMAIRVWLNGELLRGQRPGDNLSGGRLTATTRLRKGRNELFLKTLRSWQDPKISAVVVYQKRYEVEVTADTDRGPFAAPGGAARPPGEKP